MVMVSKLASPQETAIRNTGLHQLANLRRLAPEASVGYSVLEAHRGVQELPKPLPFESSDRRAQSRAYVTCRLVSTQFAGHYNGIMEKHTLMF